MKDKRREGYTPIEILNIFKRDLISCKDDIEYTVEDIKSHAPKGINGEYEENSYLKVKQAQLETVSFIYNSFVNLIDEMEEKEI